MVPPWDSMIERQIVSPIPVPVDFVVKRLEDTVLVFSIYSCPGVFYGDKDSGGPLNDTGPYPQLPRTIGDRVHGFDRVHSQVQKNLLQLASIGQQGLESFA